MNNEEESVSTEQMTEQAVSVETEGTAAAPADNKMQFGLKSFLTICGILLAIIIAVGILTYVIPAGRYELNPDGSAIEGSFQFVDDAHPLPVWRWFTAPFEALVVGKNSVTIIGLIALLLVLGGTFNVLDDTGGLLSVVRIIVGKFYNRRYLSVWLITLIIMLLSSLFGLQEQLLILFPILLMYSQAMRWSNTQAISLVLVASGVGFTVAIFNPVTIGIASGLAGVPITSGIWYRIVMFVVFYIVTSCYLVFMAKRDEKVNADKPLDLSAFQVKFEEERKQDNKKAMMIGILFGSALIVIIVSTVVPALKSLSTILMAVAFVVGTFIIGSMLLGGFKKMITSFGKGMLTIAPSIVIIVLAYGVTYIADKGDILHTIFHFFSESVKDTSPYVTVLLLYALVLVIEFFIPSASSKAALLIPLLTLAPIPGVSKNVILLVYLFADGYTNVLFPTCGTLVVGLSLAKVGYLTWLKKTIVFQLILLVMSIGFLYLALAIGL